METHLTVKGLVLRETAFRDADKMVDLLTENGILAVQARSARKPGSKYAALTQLFCYGEYCLRQNKGRYYLDSAVLLDMFYGIRTDYNAFVLASYFSELVRRTTSDQPQPQILRLCLLAMHHLAKHDRPLKLMKAAFEMRLLAELGLMPNLLCCPFCLRYEIAAPVLRIDEADVCCAECLTEQKAEDLSVTASALQAARHVLYADLDRVFAFRMKGNSEEMFAGYAEKYLVYRLGDAFPALKTYKEISKAG